MRLALGEIPHVADLQLCELVLAVLVDSRHEDGAGVDVTPFSLNRCELLNEFVSIKLYITHSFVPVKLTDRALGEMLLSRRDVGAHREVCDDLLPNPSSLEEASLGVGETPFQVGNDAIVGALLAQVVGVLKVQGLVRTPCDIDQY